MSRMKLIMSDACSTGASGAPSLPVQLLSSSAPEAGMAGEKLNDTTWAVWKISLVTFHYVGKLIDFFQKNIRQLIQECLSCGVSNLLLASNVMQLESVRLGFFRTVSDWLLSGVTDYSEMQHKIGQFSTSFGVLGRFWGDQFGCKSSITIQKSP